MWTPALGRFYFIKNVDNRPQICYIKFMRAISQPSLFDFEINDEKIIVPPIKCQGIKTKLVPFIKEHVSVPENGTWIEPFMGTGVVAFNLAPKKAILTDKNQHLINFYKGIQKGTITSTSARKFLEFHGKKLEVSGKDYYLQMRKEFNENSDPMYFLFLNRADFNGMIRFNSKGQFNVPFCQKPNRFSKAYITKICNQIANVSNIMKNKDWTFVCSNWQDTFDKAQKGDFIYIDPPYIGRDTSYVGEWPEEEAVSLAQYAHNTEASVCLSMWKENEFRTNNHLYDYWSDFKWFEQNHFYHIGGKEENRHPMIEILAIKS